MTARILLVEDEPDLARSVDYHLTREGFFVRTAATGKQALALASQVPSFDLVLLDLMLPDLSGTEVCRQLRTQPHSRDILVLMLTARGEEIDRVVGFEVGADDYMVKPYSLAELVLRIRALVRRTQGDSPGGVLRCGALRLDVQAHACWLDDRAVSLSPVEMRLLAALMRHQGRVLSRQEVLDVAWPPNTPIGERTVDATVKRLREKLGPAGAMVETLRSVGYRMRGIPQQDR